MSRDTVLSHDRHWDGYRVETILATHCWERPERLQKKKLQERRHTIGWLKVVVAIATGRLLPWLAAYR
jgi:hypothetical protein